MAVKSGIPVRNPPASLRRKGVRETQGGRFAGARIAGPLPQQAAAPAWLVAGALCLASALWLGSRLSISSAQFPAVLVVPLPC